MKLHLAAACAVLSLAAGPAFAEGRVSATLETPTAAKTKLIVAHSVFVCDGATCVAGVGHDDAQGLAGCKELARKVGRVSAYSGEFKTLDADALAACNAVAKAPAVTNTASN